VGIREFRIWALRRFLAHAEQIRDPKERAATVARARRLLDRYEPPAESEEPVARGAGSVSASLPASLMCAALKEELP
jgi:hypothetical protein